MRQHHDRVLDTFLDRVLEKSNHVHDLDHVPFRGILRDLLSLHLVYLYVLAWLINGYHYLRPNSLRLWVILLLI